MSGSFVNQAAIEKAFSEFKGAFPFDHCVIDNFLQPEILEKVTKEFLEYDSPKWFFYKNAIENKKALNDWNAFPNATYSLFNFLNSPDFVSFLSGLLGKKLYADCGLHGGGWHIHGSGGNLNPHLDYSIHPKLGLQRAMNIIIYASPELKEEHGGHLGLWTYNTETHSIDKLVKEVTPVYNRAVIFDTTQNSWHGMCRPLVQPEGIYRKSFAVYYLCTPPSDADPRERALFAPRENQKNDKAIEELIKLRSGVETSKLVYNK